jgi:hypothetical protein
VRPGTAFDEMAPSVLTTPEAGGGQRAMTTYPRTVEYTLQERQRSKQPNQPSPIGYARGYEIDPAQEDAIFTARRTANTTIKRTTTPVQVVRRGKQVLIVEPQEESRGAPSPAPDRRTASQPQHQRRTTAAIERQADDAIDTEDLPVTRPPSGRATHRRLAAGRVHWFLPASVGAVVMLGIYLGGSALFGWFQTTLDDLHYGRPRTYQTDARVGHGDSVTPSHFIALNIHRHVEIMELPGNDPAHARVYVGPVLTGDGQDMAPVTLTFRDVNGDGKVDMLVTIQNEQLVYLNTGSSFRESTPSDHMTL